MITKHINGHEIIEHGASDLATLVQLCPTAINEFNSMQESLSKHYYLEDYSIDELVKKANNMIANVKIEDTLDAFALSVTFNKFRIQQDMGDKYLDVISRELIKRYSFLKNRYIVNNISGKFK